MVAYMGHVVRRGVEASVTTIREGQQLKVEVPVWGQALLATTFIVFTIVLSSLEYTLKDVVATLAMVESPSADIALTSTDAEGADASLMKDSNVEDGPVITLVRQKPITSKIRTTLRHLTSQAGRLSRWRGLVPAVFYAFVNAFLTNFLDAVIPRFIPGRLFTFSALSAVLLVRIHAAWIHTVISMPSNKRFWQRIPSASAWRQLWIPAAVEACAGYVSLYITIGFVRVLGLHRLNGNELSAYKGGDWVLLAVRVSAIIAVALLTALFIILPATVTLVRVEASLLPEDEETIVPFDRSFGGKVIPTILGGTGAIGFVDAWRSFNWEARRRLVKLYGKICLIMFAVTLVMAHVLIFEVWAVMGPAIRKMIAEAQTNGAQGEYPW